MLKSLLSFALLLVVLSTAAQTVADTAKKSIPGADDIYVAVEQLPEFPGGTQEFMRFIAHNIRYPARARENTITGRVFGTFVVEPNGSLSDVKITKGIGYGCDEEVVRVIRLSPKWKPGIQNGRPVRVQYNVPVTFNLEVNGVPIPPQKKERIKLPVTDTLVQYYKYPDQLVHKKEYADYMVFVYPPDPSRLYPFKQFYVDGKPKLYGMLREEDGELFLQGQCVEYYPQGGKMSTVNYNNEGKKNGSEYLFYPNGKLNSEKQHDPKYSREQFITCNDSVGNKLASNGNGKWVIYNSSFDTVIQSGPIKKGVPHGEWTTWKNDSTQIISTMDKGVVKEERIYFKVESKFLSVDELPMYRGSYKALNAYVRKNLKDPRKDKSFGINNIVLVAVTVKPDGTFLNVEVAKPLSIGCNEEAVRVIRSTEPWVPNANLQNPLKIFFPVYFGDAYGRSNGFNYPPSLSVD
ncbi:MAG: TonB family protein [Mucilaginibacter sp.]